MALFSLVTTEEEGLENVTTKQGKHFGGVLPTGCTSPGMGNQKSYRDESCIFC